MKVSTIEKGCAPDTFPVYLLDEPVVAITMGRKIFRMSLLKIYCGARASFSRVEHKQPQTDSGQHSVLVGRAA